MAAQDLNDVGHPSRSTSAQIDDASGAVGRGEAQVVTPSGLLVRDLDESFADIRRRMRTTLGPGEDA